VADRVAVGVHQNRREPPLAFRCQIAHHRRQQLLRRDGHPCAGVLDVKAQLAVRAHRIHRHHDSPGTQHAVECDDELRAILAQQQHAVTGLHAQSLAQEASQ
jgi:hypothetical protein